MSKQRVKKFWIREVESSRKSCPKCGSLKRTMKDARIITIGECLRGKWFNAVDRCCEHCFAEIAERDLIPYCVSQNVQVNFVGYSGCKVPWFLSDPLIFADWLEDQEKPNTAAVYRNMDKHLEKQG